MENTEVNNENSENQELEGGGIQENAASKENAQVPENTPQPITDEVLFSEISKRYENIKSKEDLDKIYSFKPDEYIKPKSDLIKKLNDWNGKPEDYLKVANLDVEKLDNKSAIIQDMMIKEGLTEKIAELRFKQKFGAAFLSDEDLELDEDKKDEKLLAEYELGKAAVDSKKNLSQWRASSEEVGFRQPDNNDVKRMEDFQKEWVAPVKQAVDSLQKLSMETKYQLPDKTEVTEPFNYLIENPKTKEIVADMLTSPSSDLFMQKFMTNFGLDDKGKLNFAKLTESLTFLLEKSSFIEKAMAVGASKGVANHLSGVRPGNLKDKNSSSIPEAQGFEAIKQAWNSTKQ